MIGAHVSIAGGIFNAPANAAKEGLECFQMFTRSPQGGPAPALTEEIVSQFRSACVEHGQQLWVVHTPYYINLASAEAKTRASSVRVIREELERSSRIGATYCMTHLGSAREVGKAEGRAFVVEGLKKILDGYHGSTQFLIEISAGAGAVIGDTFDEIAAIIEAVENSSFRPSEPRERAEKSRSASPGDLSTPLRSARDDERDGATYTIGVCFDTQHAFGSGYDLRSPASVATVMADFDRTIGLARLKMSHVNDSKVELGEKKDRHEHIGLGKLGKNGIRSIVTHPAFRNIPLILETETEGREEDVRLLKGFLG